MRKEMKSSIRRVVRTLVLMGVLFILQYKYDIGFVGSLLVAFSSFTWGICEFVDTGLK